MALIICKECGNEFSDMAAACPTCAAPTIYSLPGNQPTAAVPHSLHKPQDIEQSNRTPVAPEPVISQHVSPQHETDMPSSQQSEHKAVSPLLAIGIFFFPFIFSWFLLKEGYSRLARGIAFGWLAFCLVITIQYIMIGIGIYRDLHSSDTPAETSDSQAVIKVTAQKLYEDYGSNEQAADERYKGKTLLVSGVIDSIGNGFGDKPYLTLESGSMLRSVRARLDLAESAKAMQLEKGQTVQIKCIGESASFGSPTLSQCKIIGVAKLKPAEETAPEPSADISVSTQDASDAADAAAAAAADIEQFPMQNAQPAPARPTVPPASDPATQAPAEQPDNNQPAPATPEQSGEAPVVDPQGSIF